jgi:uncharacterized membrane protein YkvA (DUF1232 family)
MKLKAKAEALNTYIPALFIAMKRSETPISAKIFASITVGYALSPVDIIPDFIPVLGYLDDIIILPLLVALTIKLIPLDIMEECKQEAHKLWKEGKPRKWRYAIPIIASWIAIAAILIWRAVD